MACGGSVSQFVVDDIVEVLYKGQENDATGGHGNLCGWAVLR